MYHDAGSSRAFGVRHFLPQIIHLYQCREYLSSGFIHNWAHDSSDDPSCPLSRGSFLGSISRWMSPIFDWEKLLSHHSRSLEFLPSCRPCLGPFWILLNYIVILSYLGGRREIGGPTLLSILSHPPCPVARHISAHSLVPLLVAGSYVDVARTCSSIVGLVVM